MLAQRCGSTWRADQAPEGKLLDTLEPGSRIGDYQLESQIGSGGFGTVWRARSVTSGQRVAIKVLTGALSRQGQAALRGEVELLAATASSKSNHVVRVLGGGEEPVPYIVMELVEGTDLASRLREQDQLSIDQTVDVGLAIADALTALESVGIVHRDVKPGNVMIEFGGTIKLADFGIAKIVGFETVTATGQLPMTMAYAAPEVWEGQPTHQSDLYALGILLYECLTGHTPFTGPYASLYRQHLSAAPDMDALPSETPSRLRGLIAECLAKEPRSRPSAQAVEAQLREVRTELPDSSYGQPASPLARFGPWIIVEPHPDAAWSWLCRHETTEQIATVEILFTDDVREGTQIRTAVSANPSLVAVGAQTLIASNRLLLRPDETWPEPPPGEFAFWVAREELTVSEATVVVTTALLEAAVESLQALIGAATESGVRLTIDPTTASISASGDVRLRRPGLPPLSDTPIEEQAMSFLQSLNLDDETRGILAAAASLEDVKSKLLAPEAIPDDTPSASPELGVANVASDSGIVAVEDEGDSEIVTRPESEYLEFADQPEEPATTDTSLLRRLASTPSTLLGSVRRQSDPAVAASQETQRLPVGAAIASGLAGATLVVAAIVVVGLSTGEGSNEVTYFATPSALSPGATLPPGSVSVRPSGTILWGEDFDASSGLFPQESSSPESYEASYEDGTYLIENSGDGSVALPIPVDLVDSITEIDVELDGSASQEDRYAGVACRSQEPESMSGYRLEANLDSLQVAVVRLDDGVGTPLAAAKGANLNAADQSNRLGIQCADGHITALVNGTEIMSVTDAAYERGGGYLWLHSEGPETVRFDNFVVSQP